MTTEIWFTTNNKGAKSAWYFNFRVRRAFRIAMAKAELMIATGEAEIIAKPSYVGAGA